MSTRTVEQVENWQRRPFDGGYRELQRLADDDFSGVVTAGMTRLCMLNGRVVGILEGSIEDFEDTDGTAREAPSPALPLLVVMQERSDEVRAKYYTEDTPLSEVDRTLSEGGFTGYVELSENVLSGDYLTVYHGGRSMSVAYVGESKQLLTGDEAFERAEDEVGIYEVKPVDIEIIDIPEIEEEPAADEGEPGDDSERDAAAVAGADDPESAEPAAEPATEPATEDGSTGDESVPSGPDPEPGVATSEVDAGGETAAESDSEPGGETPPSAEAESEGPVDGSDERADRREAAGEQEAAGAESSAGQSGTDSAGEGGRPGDGTRGGNRQDTASGSERSETPATDRVQSTARSSGPASPDAPESGVGPERESGTGGPDPDVPNGKATDEVPTADAEEGTESLETHAVPSLDPERTWTPEREDQRDSGGTSQRETAAAEADAETGRNRSETADRRSGQGPTADPANAGGHSTGEQASELRAELEARSQRIEALKEKIETLAAERDELAAERDRLAGRIEELEARIERLEAGADGDVATGEALSPAAAIDGTNLFVRYQSKSNPTLESIREGDAEPAAVNENLRLEYHTQFDADTVTVNGESFGAFLEGTIEYRFVSWLIRELLPEIRRTGHRDDLEALYEALPKIDRAELRGAASVEYTEGGETHRSQESFDIVLRDRMGHPLFVANIKDAREAASENMMASLITAGERVGTSNETFAAAFLVTSSFFEPEALETAAEATNSGLLSRDKRRSFVKLSRKQGFHLCLVEARNENFHLAVPEL